MNNIRIRRAVPQDSQFLLETYNHPDIQKYGSAPRIIPVEEHEAWFAERLCSAHSFIYIAFIAEDENPIGYIRFEEKDRKAVLSVAILLEYRNKRLGLSLINEGCKRLIKDADVDFVIAKVRKDNQRVFTYF